MTTPAFYQTHINLVFLSIQAQSVSVDIGAGNQAVMCHVQPIPRLLTGILVGLVIGHIQLTLSG